jgi:hypothetical protein
VKEFPLNLETFKTTEGIFNQSEGLQTESTFLQWLWNSIALGTSVSIVSYYRLYDRGSIPGRGK